MWNMLYVVLAALKKEKAAPEAGAQGAGVPASTSAKPPGIKLQDGVCAEIVAAPVIAFAIALTIWYLLDNYVDFEDGIKLKGSKNEEGESGESGESGAAEGGDSAEPAQEEAPPAEEA